MIGNDLKTPGAWDEGEDGQEVQLWFHRLSEGIKRRRKEEVRWERNENFFDMKHWEQDSDTYVEASGDQVTINKVGSWSKSRRAATAFKNPKAVIRGQNKEAWQQVPVQTTDTQTGQPEVRMVARYQIMEHLLNYLTQQPSFGLKRAGRRAILADHVAYGAVKVGYTAEFEDVKPVDEQQVPIGPDGLPDLSGFEADQTTGELLRDRDNRLIPKGGGPIAEQWFTDWAKYRNLVIDPDGENEFRDHRWVAYEVIRPLKEVKADRLLENTEDLEASGSSYEDERPKPEIDNVSDLDPYVRSYCEQVRLFYIEDFEKKRWIVLADGCGKKLRDIPTPKGIDHSSYVMLRSEEKPGEFYPLSAFTELVPINQEYNIHRTQAVHGVRHSARKALIDKKLATTENMGKLTSPLDNEYVVNDTGQPNEGMVTPVSWPSLPPDLYMVSQQSSKDFDEVGGQPPSARGQQTGGTATEHSIIETHNTLREDDDRNLVAEFYQEIYKKLLDSLQANMTLPQAIAVTGADGQVWQAEIDETMIIGDMDVTVDVSEMKPRNSNIEISRFNQALMNIANAMKVAPAMFINPSATEAILDMYEVKNEPLRDGLVAAGQMMMQMLMMQAQPADEKTPDRGAPENEAQNRAQQGGYLGASI